MSDTNVKTAEAVEYVKSRTDCMPVIGIILGSGLGPVAERLSESAVIPYSDIPGFPMPTVKGHHGNLVCGKLSGIPAAVMQGRLHHYEGYYMRDITFPVRVLAGLGAKTLIVTNASGGIRDDLAPGSIAAVTDHINLMGTNPLLGLEDAGGGGQFLDLTGAYDRRLIGAAAGAAMRLGVSLSEGVLAAVSGPCYETPAEVRMLKALGADIVCMSTVPEVIMARYLGMGVLCLSLVTNRAAGLSNAGPSHEEVLEEAKRRHGEFASLVEGAAVEMSKKGLL